MKRPQSAKQVRNYLAQTVNEDAPSFEEPRHFVKIGKKQMFHAVTSSNDLSRLMPKKILQDKEQLYHETLQLKNNLNEVNEENIRLRTKVALLQREKDRANRNEQQRMSKGKSSNFLNVTRSEKENGIVNNLKKLVRQTREENQSLQNEIAKIKKTIKYTKINEIQVEKQAIFEQNKKLAKLMQKYETELDSRIRQDEELRLLETELSEKTHELNSISNDNIKYEQLLDEMEMQYRETSQKLLIQQRKWQRDCAVERRKVEQLNKHVQQLKQEVKTLTQQLEVQRKKTIQAKKQRPASSRPYQQMDSTSSLKSRDKEKEKEEAMQINEKLKYELEEAKRKLAESQSQLKTNKLASNGSKEGRSETAPNFKDIDHLKNIQLKEQDEEYHSDFQETTVKPVKTIKELPIEQKVQSKVQVPLKDPLLNEISEILTYRMKYNRYLFKELKADIELSPLNCFIFQDLFSMLTAEPFFLTHSHALEFLKICYGKSKINLNDQLSSDIFVENLRLVIRDFSLLDEQEEEKQLYKIAEFMTKNRTRLEGEFKKVKDKNGCISKSQLIKVLNAFSSISEEEIDLAICYISVSTETLSAIDYQDFLDRFFINKSSLHSSKHSKRLPPEQDLSLGENEQLDGGELIADDELV